MDFKSRAELVRQALEEKQAARLRGFRKPGDPNDGDRSFSRYNGRRMRDEPDYGGDASLHDASARWDRFRNSSRSRRRRLDRAPRGGYVGYNGDHQGYFASQARRKRRQGAAALRAKL